MNKGDRGYFGRKNGEKTYGEIVKVNAKSLKVKTLEGRGTRRDYAVGTVWKVAKTLWTPEIAGREVRPEIEILADLRRVLAQIAAVESDLSPENLSCDGELSAFMVGQRGKALRGLRARLENNRRDLVADFGRVPTPVELGGAR